MSKPSLVCSTTWDFPLDKPGSPKEMLAIVKERAHTCAQDLKREGIDLSGYNTNESADDIESLRIALGVKKISLWGISYGTHLALAAIRRHEGNIHRVILTGVSGMDSAMLKLPSIIQQQLGKADQVLKTDATLSKQDTDFIGLLMTLLDQLDKNPVTVEVLNAKTGQNEKITLGKWDLQFFTAAPITQTWGIRSLPSFYTALSKGDFTPLARAALDFRKAQIGSIMPPLMICASGVSDERYNRVTLEAKQTLLSDAINFPFPEVCEALGNPDLQPRFRTPVKSNMPVLLISGTLDGRTPVSNAEEVRTGFPNSKHVIIEGASHGYDLFFFIPRVKEVMQEFLKEDRHTDTK